MKIKSIYLVLAIMLGVIQSVMADEAFRRHRYDSWKSLSLPENAIVFVGNSITDMPLWSEFFGNDPRVVNRGNSGGYSFEVLNNVESWVRFKPAKVFIKIGTNDLGTNYTEQSIADNISKTVNIIRRESPNTEIYLQSILPAADQNYKTAKTIKATNVLIEQIAQANENTTYVDLHSKLGGIRNGAPYSLDALHLEAYGYKIWVDAIKQYVGLESSFPDNTETIQSTATLGGAHGMRATNFSVMPTKDTDILFFGDEMVKNGEWNELLHNANIKNRGTCWGYGGSIGVTSKLVDAAFANAANGVERANPAKILLYTATEDINGSTDLATVKSNYSALVSKIKQYAPSTPVALVSLMPTASANSRITDFNAWLKSTAEADNDLTYIDIYTTLASEGKGKADYFVGNYLYGRGYVAVGHVLSEFIGDCTVITDAEAQALANMFDLRTTLNTAILTVENLKAGEGIGEYEATGYNALKAKADEASALLADANASDDDITSLATEINTLLNNIKPTINGLTDENVADKQFALSTPNRSGLNAYASESGVNATSTNPGYATYRWIFESRGDGTFNIKNVGKGTYMDPTTSFNAQIRLVTEAPTAGWSVDYSNNLGLYVVKSGETCQLNTTTKANNPVYNWYGNGKKAADRDDLGCQWLIKDVTDTPVVPEPEPIKVVTGTAQQGAATITNGRIYTITNHQLSGVCYPLYVDNNVLQYGTANALASKSYGRRAQFEAISKDNGKFAFKNVETGDFLVWRGNNAGTNGNSGFVEEYDPTYCDFTITSVSEVQNGKTISGVRDNGSVGTFIQMASGVWDKWSATGAAFTASYSNVYTFGDVTDGNDGEMEDQPDDDTPDVDTNWESDIDWYTMQIGSNGFYISNNGSSNYITLSSVKTEFADADLWHRTGDATNGYTLYNKEAGPDMVLAAPTAMTGQNGGTSYPIMVDKNNVPQGYTTKWAFTTSTDLGANVEAFYIAEQGYPANKINNRESKLAFWSAGANAGSSVRWTWAQRTVAVNMSTGSFTSSNGNWAKTWTASSTNPQLTLDAAYNNMSIENSNATQIQAYRGLYEPQAYTFTAGSGYSIAAYSFDFVKSTSAAINLTDALGTVYTASADTQTVNCTGLKEANASFTLSGSNNGINIVNLLVTIRKAAVEPEPQFEVFPTRTSQDIPYRIPAIATAYDGTIVAVADYRYSRVDIGSGRIDLHIRRSHDNGQTWDEILQPTVMRGDGDKTAGHQETGFGDPCIVGDSESPRMLITSCSGTPGFFGGSRQHHQGWAHFWSDDNGATWSAPVYKDEEFIYSKFDNSAYGPIRGWFVGSGKICQSRTVKVGNYYRLYCVGSSCRQGSNQTANWALYSDDFGETWEFLGGCDESPVPNGDEPKAEELPDGSVLLSSRTTGGRNFNIFTFTDSKSAKGSWGSVTFSGSGNNGVVALSNACNGEVMLLPVTRKADNKDMFLLLQSVPFGSGRSNVGIYYKELTELADYRTSDAIAKNWTGRHQSSFVGSAYSTMTLQKNSTIGFLYEEDTYSCNGGGGYNIVYKNYSVEQITDSAYTYKANVDGDSLTAIGMAAVVEDVTDESNVGTTVGQYTEEGIEQMQSAYQTYAQNPTRQGYEQLNNALANAPRIGIDPNIYYTIRNYGRGNGNYQLNANTSTVLSVSTTKETDNAKWCFVASDDDPEIFYLYNKQFENSILGPTLAQETRSVLTSDLSAAGRYRIVSTPQGLSKFQCLNPTNSTYYHLHLAGDNTRIVPWLATSPANNTASFWYIEPTDDLTAVTDFEAISCDQDATPVYYDLQGRRVEKPVSGQIYISAGRLVKAN